MKDANFNKTRPISSTLTGAFSEIVSERVISQGVSGELIIPSPSLVSSAVIKHDVVFSNEGIEVSVQLTNEEMNEYLEGW